MPPIRIMHVIARMNVGGPAVEIAELMRGLNSSEFQQVLVTGYCGPDEADYLMTQARDIEAIRIDGLGRAIAPGVDALALARLVRLIRQQRPDIVHTHTAKAGVLGRIAAKLSGTGARVIHTHHGHLLHGYFGPSKTKAVIAAERALSRITDTIVAVGERVRDDLLASGVGHPGQYVVIRSGVRIGKLPDRDQARADLGIDGDSIVVAMIGRLTRIKRPDRLADVARIMKDRNLDVRFIVAGGGDEEPALRARIEQEQLPIELLGWRNDLERILAATDVVILTSDNEGTPLSIIEAALAGVPAVATDVGAVTEIINDRVTGLTVPPDATLLSNALISIVHDEKLRTEYGHNAHRRAKEYFSLSKFLLDHRRTYEGFSGRQEWTALPCEPTHRNQ